MFLLFFQKKKQQQLSAVKSLAELGKQVKEVLGVLGLLSSLSYSEVMNQCLIFLQPNFSWMNFIFNLGFFHWTGFGAAERQGIKESRGG